MALTQTYKRKNNIIAAGIVVLINALFILKYLARYVNHAGVYAMLYMVIAAFGYWLWANGKVKLTRGSVLSLTALFALAFMVALQILPATKLNVDRWSVIYSFWQTAFNGQYPYNSQSHMGNFPGPLPVYFIMALPFYAVKEIGYMPLLSCLLFVGYIFKRGKRENSDYSFTLLLLLASPCIYWEIIARSTLFFVSLLWLIYMEWLLSKQLSDKKHLLFSGVLGGLLLSTRFIYAVVLSIAAIYLWRRDKNLRRIILWGIVSIVVFALTIIPLWFVFPTEFVQYNPFHTEASAFVPFAFNFLFLAIALCCGLLCKSDRSVAFLSGISLVLIVLTYFTYHIILDGWDNAFTNSYADISYFIMAIPFLLISIVAEPESTPQS